MATRPFPLYQCGLLLPLQRKHRLRCSRSKIAAIALARSAIGWAEAALSPLNPDKMSLDRTMREAIQGRTSMTVCSSSDLMTEPGQHGMASLTLENCAGDGWTGVMTWILSGG